VTDRFTDSLQAKELEKVVFYINSVLTAPESVLALNNGREVEVFDNSRSEAWIILGSFAVKQFEEAGWSVRPTTEPHHFMFQLPQRWGGYPVKPGEKA
jgi:hypothetical protein